MILFLDRSGPMIKYEDGMLHVEDLNPEVKTRWVMSRWQMVRLAWECLLSAIFSQ